METSNISQERIISAKNLPNFFDLEAGAVLLIDKPLDWTSFDVVNKIRFAIKHQFKLKKIKVGHAGTLDPKATGLLIVCTGKFTKLLDQIANDDKSYTGVIKLGAVTASYDRESAEEHQQDISHIGIDVIMAAKAKLTGRISQRPPVFSAIKINGQEAYKLVRRGEDVEMKLREVTIHGFDIKSIHLPFLDFEVRCSKGTYIRSLAHDLGQLLGVGGYLYNLCRTGVGKYDLSEAIRVEEAVDWIRALPTPHSLP